MSYKVRAIQEGKLGQILGTGVKSYVGAVKLGQCWCFGRNDRRYLVIIEKKAQKLVAPVLPVKVI